MARRRRPLQVGEVAAGVLEQRALVHHRQLEVGVGVVDRLAAGLGQHDEPERERRRPVRRLAPTSPGRAGRRAQREQVGARPGEREEHEHQQQHRLDADTANVRSRAAPISPKPPPVSHAASVIAKRPSASSPTSTSASLPTGQPGERPPIGTSTSAISSEPATTAGASS